VDWSTLEFAHLEHRSDQLPTGELAAMICRAQTPQQFSWLAWAFAKQGQTALWLHTITRAVQVLCDPLKLRTFITEHFLLYPCTEVHPDIEPHVLTMLLVATVRLNYKAGPGDRTVEQQMLGHNMGITSLIPRACEEHSLTAR